MADSKDAPQVVIHPPIALALGLIVGFGLDRLYPLPFVPPSLPRAAIGLVLFLLGVLLAGWSARTFRNAHTNVLTSQPASTIVSSGPYGFSRNPIYLGMFLGLFGIAIGFDTLWILAAAAVLFFVLRFGVIAREERYLEGKFGSTYLDYKARVRRWL
ncbi:MAG TPA: isoprenylcysteine carboxylmethyltransferase family protein [Rhizomicrobium sp.]|nr:isoprenylcysteine carboxylmethyltransferase family protein [Rhizomicrobium sp.]